MPDVGDAGAPPARGPVALALLERVARLARRIGLGRLVDAAGATVGRIVARRQPVFVDGFELRGNHAGHLW